MLRRSLLTGAAAFIASPALPRPGSAAPSSERQVLHVLDRLGFGPTVADIRHIKAIGIEHYLEEQLDAEVEAWCREILALSPTAIAIAKRSFNADSENIKGIGALGLEALALYYDTDEAKEGTQAFLEKRRPDFRQRR